MRKGTLLCNLTGKAGYIIVSVELCFSNTSDT